MRTYVDREESGHKKMSVGREEGLDNSELVDCMAQEFRERTDCSIRIHLGLVDKAAQT